MNKYILIKCQFGVNNINSCYFSGMTLEDIYSFLGAPSELLLSYNDFDSFCRLKKDDFLKFIQNRREYYDIVCSDISADCKQITTQEVNEFLSFTDINTPDPMLWLPTVSNNFCIYSHDESLYSYLCFRMKPEEFVNRFLNYVIFSLSNESERQFEQTDLAVFLKAIQNGIYIDTEHTVVTNDVLYVSVGCFDSQTDFSGNLYSEQLPKFESIKLNIMTFSIGNTGYGSKPLNN